MLFSLALIVSVAGFGILCADGPAFAKAAKKPTLTKTSVTMETGTAVKLRVKHAGKKVKWTVSNKKVVTIKKKSGDFNQTVVLKAGKKAGTCMITAKVGKRTLRCHVTVGKPGFVVGPGTDPEWPEAEQKQLSESSVDLAKDYSFAASTETDSSEAFQQAFSDFSVRLLQQVLKEDTNAKAVLISPDSVLTALTMTENGAAGRTLSEMQKVLTGSLPLADANENLLRLHSGLMDSKDYIYTNTNSIWARDDAIKSVKVAPAFLETNKKYYNASFYQAPFNDETVTDINKWVYNNTRNMIDKIIDPNDGLSEDARMLLINAVAFEGLWYEHLYALPRAEDKIFTAADGSKQTVNMLAGSGSTYLELAGGTGFCYPYRGGDIGFVGLLPPKDMNARDYAATLSGKDFLKAWADKQTPKGGVKFRLPAFTYDYSTSMKDVLKSMGMQLAFSNAADFSGMLVPETDPALQEDLKIGDVLHKTHIELDENGTKAAAVTAVTMEKATSVMNPPVPEYVYLDRPFVYALVDMKTGCPLFLGMIESVPQTN